MDSFSLRISPLPERDFPGKEEKNGKVHFFLVLLLDKSAKRDILSPIFESADVAEWQTRCVQVAVRVRG